MERYGLTAVVPIPTALLLWSLNDLQFFFGFYALFLSFRAQSLIFNLRVTIFLLTVDCHIVERNENLSHTVRLTLNESMSPGSHAEEFPLTVP